MSEFHFNWDRYSSFFNLVPAFTTGFWHIILPSIVEHDCRIILSSKQQFREDFPQDFNLAIIVPGMIDFMRTSNIDLPLQKFDMIASGASQVLPRHTEFLFEKGCRVFNHIYGATEIGSPVLGHKSTQMNEKVNYLELTEKAGLKDGELIHDGHATADFFDQEGNFIKYPGRSNDIVKMNGYQCSLLLIENKLEELEELGEVMALPKYRAGTDFIKILHTHGTPDKNQINGHLEPYVPACNLPLKDTKKDTIPRNALNKKVRNVTEVDKDS